MGTDILSTDSEPIKDWRRAYLPVVSGTVAGTAVAFRATFTDGGHVHISCGSQYDPGTDNIVVRGVPYRVSLHLHAPSGGGPWALRPGRDGLPYLSRTDRWDLEPTDSARRWFADVFAPAVGAWVASDPTAIRAALIASFEDANGRVEDATKERDAAHELAAIRDGELVAAREAAHAAAEALARFEHKR